MPAKDPSSTSPDPTTSPPKNRVPPPAFDDVPPPSPPLDGAQPSPLPDRTWIEELPPEAGFSDDFDLPAEEALGQPNTTTGGQSPASFGSRKAIKEAVAEGVRAVTSRMNDLTRDEFARDQGAWLADDRDANGIAEPVSKIVHRRGGLGAVTNPDVGDAIAAGIALAVYAFKQLNLRASIRRGRRAHDAAYPPPTEDAAGEAA